MFLQMLKDEFPEVRLHIISKLELVNQGTHPGVEIAWNPWLTDGSHWY